MNPTSVSYRVRLLPAQHEIAVEMTIAAAPGDVLLSLPTWMPGAYAFMRYARDISNLRAEDLVSSAPLRVSAEGWQGFRVHHTSGTLRVTYVAYVFEPAWGELCGLVDHEHAILLGTHYFTVVGHTGPVRVTYEAPSGWPIHHPSGAEQVDAQSWAYPTFALLLDTPVLFGAIERRTRAIEGTPFHFVFVDRCVGFESEVEPFIDELVKIARECRAIFGSFPFKDYSFLFSFNPTAHWGLEHNTSTMIGIGETCFVDTEQRARALRVSAHELFHAWNVCTLKPHPFGQYVPEGAFTEGLWVGEGFTRYYEFLLCVRSGALTPQQFLSNVVNYFRHLEAMPAYERVSAVDSSRQTFVNHHKYGGSINNTIDYYDKGMLIAFDLDAQLRMSPQPSSLDREMGAFYDGFVGSKLGFTTDDAIHFFARAAPGVGELLHREVLKPGGLSTPQLLEKLGFELTRSTVPTLGVVLKENSGPVIANVLDTAPAARAGLAPEDRIVQLNGFPYTFKALRWLIAAGKPFRLEVVRGHRQLSFTVETAPRTWISTLVWRGSAAQLTRLRDWLKRPELSLQPGEAVPLTSFENFHGIQTVI